MAEEANLLLLGCGGAAPAAPGGGDVLLLETGGTDNLLLETNDGLLKE